MTDTPAQLSASVLRELRRTIDAAPRPNAAILHEYAAAPVAGVGGPRVLCGTVCLAVAVSLGASEQDALPLATAVQLYETAGQVLVLAAMAAENDAASEDGVGDWGMPLTLNAGDGLLSLGHDTVLTATGKGLSAASAVRAAGILDAAALQLCAGLEGNPGLEWPGTGDSMRPRGRFLAGAAAALGGLVAGVDDAAIKALKTFGEEIGLAAGQPDQAGARPTATALETLAGLTLSQEGRDLLAATASQAAQGAWA